MLGLRVGLLLATCGLTLVLAPLMAGGYPVLATEAREAPPAPGHAAAGDREASDVPVGSWQVTDLPGVRLVPSHEPAIKLKPDGSINGHSGCNTFGSQAVVTATGIAITNSFMTRMGCEEARHAVERALLEALEGATAFEIDGDVLTLSGEKGQTLVTFERTEEPSDAVQVVEQATPEARAFLFRNVRVFDGNSPELSDPSNVLIEGNLISTISTDPIEGSGTNLTVIDGKGGTLMPGLIDAHWHTMAVGVTPEVGLQDIGLTYLVAGVEAEAALMRGFTTVRDMGGPSFSLKRAIDAQLIAGPRIYPSGAMITVTSGHGDFRTFAELPRHVGQLSRMEEIGMSMLADSPDEVRLRVREQLMQGAAHIKLTAGGGVASPFSPLDVSTFTEEEIRAAVEAAENWGTYVTVHAYTSHAIQGAIRAGVRVIEHGHLMDEETARLIADKDIWLSIQPFDEHMTAAVPPGSQDKLRQVLDGTQRGYELARQHGIKMAFGTDILFSSKLARAQGAMLVNMLEWFTPAEILQMATATNAELLLLSGKRNPYPGRLGVIEEGALADLLLIKGNPLEDLSLIADAENNLLVIMKDGVLYKNNL